MKDMFNSDDLRMIIKFEEDIVEESHNSKNNIKNERVYVLVYDFSEEVFWRVSEFILKKLSIENE
jgi:hypothetical protein